MATRGMERDRDEALNLYLDDLLPPAERVAFERRLQGDATLRAAVEFHRGLTLEFREETPPLPRDYEETARRRFERAVAGLPVDEGASSDRGSSQAAESWRGVRRVATGVVLVLLLLAIGYLLRQGRAPSRDDETGPRDTAAPEAAGAEPTPDLQTIEALRSLGYITGGEENAPGPPAARPQATATAKAPAAAPGPSAPEPLADRVAQSPAQKEPQPHGETPIDYRWLEVGRAPALGRDHEIVRDAAAWKELVGAPDAPVDFGTEMAVVLRHRLGSDPPSRLVPVAISIGDAAIRIECRVERDDPADAPAASPGQALILPASDLAIRIVMR